MPTIFLGLERFEKQAAYLDANPGCVALGSKTLFIDAGGMPIFEFGDCFSHDTIDHFHLTQAGCRICHSSAMMRREMVINIGLYNEARRYAQDLDLFLRLAEIGELANLREVLHEYRYHLASISFAHRQQQRQEARRAAESAWIRRGLDGILDVPDWPEESKGELHRKWAWWALAANNVMTARKHALIALVNNPFNAENARLAYCAARGR